MSDRLSKPMQVYFDEQAAKYSSVVRKRRAQRFGRVVIVVIVVMIIGWWLANVGSPAPRKFM